MSTVLGFITGILGYLASLIFDILEQVFLLVVSIVHAVLIFFSKQIMGEFKIDSSILTDNLMGKIITTYGGAFRTIAFSILILIAAWHIFKGFFSFLGLGTETEEAWKIGMKMVVFGILILESGELCKFILTMFDKFIEGLNVNDVFQMSWVDPVIESFKGIGKNLTGVNNFIDTYGGVASLETIGRFVVILVEALFLIVFDIKLLAIAIDLSEKYIKTVLLIIIAPISFSCGVTKATNQIFNAWIKTFTGLLVSAFVKYALLALCISTFNATIFANATVAGTIKNFIIVLGLMTLVNQSDSLVNELGFSPGRATTGASGIIGETAKAGANIGVSYLRNSQR